MSAALLIVLLLGPAQTLSGKYVPKPSAPELSRDDTIEALCGRIEGGEAGPEAHAALGEALLGKGRKGLAYRAFRKAHLLAPAAAKEFKERMLQRKYECGPVPEEMIRLEEKEATEWRKALREYRRRRTAAGEDPNDLAPFYELYGRPEDDMYRHIWRRRSSFLLGAAGVFLGIGLAAFSRVLKRGYGALGLAAAGACVLGPALLGQVGLLYWGAGFSGAGGLAVALGRKRAA